MSRVGVKIKKQKTQQEKESRRKLRIAKIPRRIRRQMPIKLPQLPETIVEAVEQVQVEEEPVAVLPHADTIQRPTLSWD